MKKIALGGKHGAGLHLLVSDGKAHLFAGRSVWGDLAKDSGKIHPRCWRGGKSVLAHRLILGFGPDDPDVDHRNGDTLDCRDGNLRPATMQQNQRNDGKKRTANGRPTTSRHKGVSWEKARSKWRAQIKIGGRSKHLGLFGSETEAARAYDKAAREHFGEYARLNFAKKLRRAQCYFCGVDTPGIGENFWVRNAIWRRAMPRDTSDRYRFRRRPRQEPELGPREYEGTLCIGCIEGRIGRRLRPGDFWGMSPRRTAFDNPSPSRRLLDRLALSESTVALEAAKLATPDW